MVDKGVASAKVVVSMMRKGFPANIFLAVSDCRNRLVEGAGGANRLVVSPVFLASGLVGANVGRKMLTSFRNGLGIFGVAAGAGVEGSVVGWSLGT